MPVSEDDIDPCEFIIKNQIVLTIFLFGTLLWHVYQDLYCQGSLDLLHLSTCQGFHMSMYFHT